VRDVEFEFQPPNDDDGDGVTDPVVDPESVIRGDF
jgi:hypothetical protein